MSFTQGLEKLDKDHLRLDDIQNIVEQFSNDSRIDVKIAGSSFAGRPIYLMKLGSGSLKVFLWTQMHGDESTATASVLDLVDELLANESHANVLQAFQIYIVPMLNPDGAERRTRENAQSIDINRDSRVLQSPEGKLLDRLAKEINPDLAFNLHDQNPYYQVGDTKKPSTIAFLAPAYNHEKSISPARAKAMAVIQHMRANISADIDDAIARYNDTFSPRSFGDKIAGLGASTILIESGAASDDPNRQIARKMNLKAIIAALNYYPTLINKNDLDTEVSAYFAIPENISDAVSSLLIKNLHFISDDSYEASISIKQTTRWSNAFYIDEVGDLAEQAGLVEFDASELSYSPGLVHEISNFTQLTNQSYREWLKQGVIQFQGETSLLDNQSDYQVLFNQPLPATRAALIKGQAAYFLMLKGSEVLAAVVNGKLIHLK